MASTPLRFLILAFVFNATACLSQGSAEQILPLDGHIVESGEAVELNWFDADPPRVGSVTVNRRLYGQTGGQSWQTIATNLGPVMRYTDRSISPGKAYEYQVLRTARDIIDVGYWLSGTKLPARDRRGTAYLIVDETIAAEIAPRLQRFERDLIGDGWRVLRHHVPRGGGTDLNTLKKAVKIKEWLVAQFHEDPFGQHAVVLVGHVPLVKSGNAAPDGHEPTALETDLFYADMDGQWRALRTGTLAHNTIPGDFIEMPIGRIDFSNVSETNRDKEIHHIRAYFDKNHHWRRGVIGDLREAYGQNNHLRVEQAALRNVVGQNAITKGGHHDVGGQKPWLWGVDFGSYKGSLYATEYDIRAVFALNFGSAKQKIGTPFNPMTALLAEPWYALAVGWGARPAWWLHHMALGGTVGEMHRRTVNNGARALPYRESMDYFPTGRYLWRNPVWVNLLGDPTLRAFPLRPPDRVSLQTTESGVLLSWRASPDPDVTGYRVYRAAGDSALFEDLTRAGAVSGATFTDDSPVTNARYMVRAEGLKKVYAGSFYTLSQGAFAESSALSETGFAQDLSQHTAIGQPLILPKAFSETTDGRIYAFIEPPAIGRLDFDGMRWVYTPPTGFSGTVTLPYSVSDTWRTKISQLTVTVGD